MNIKLHTPKSLKSGSGMSSMKQLLLSLIATTISIILTFGTAALIDSRKKEAEKREMVLMILNDFAKSIEQLERLDSTAIEAFEAQISALEHPETFETGRYRIDLFYAECQDEPSKTVENIFSSNIETISTLGNITFTEKVSEFYMNRKTYRNMITKMCSEAFDRETGITTSYDKLPEYGMHTFVLLCNNYLLAQRRILKQCQQMMDVSDDELATFFQERQRWEVQPNAAEVEKNLKQINEFSRRFQQAKEKSIGESGQ